jgi:ATP-dependent DNA ligase
MLALLSREIPRDDDWLYEMKYDGFRAMIFWDGKELFIQSRDLKPLDIYFPELVTAFSTLLPRPCVVDGEIVISSPGGMDFDALQLRIHPAISRIRKLAVVTPASFVGFDLLAVSQTNLIEKPLRVRRAELEKLFKTIPHPIYLSPATTDFKRASKWFAQLEYAVGLDGLVAKKLSDPYTPGERVMVKVKHQKTADCVVAGFRWAKDKKGTAVGSLLLGLYDGPVLNYVGTHFEFQKTGACGSAEVVEAV